MNAMIVAPQPEAVEAGALVLKRGGDAIDAAIACAFMQGVVDARVAGIGGFGSMQVYMPRREQPKFSSIKLKLKFIDGMSDGACV
jgi:gamma-glutamyltranspeptidase/glutathione hydrolase